MSSLFGSPGIGYGADSLIFGLSVVLLALPLAALIAASFLDGVLRERGARGRLALAPLSLRRSTRASQLPRPS